MGVLESMSYNLDLVNGTLVTNYYNVVQVVNSQSGGIFALLILIMVFMLFLFGFRKGLDFGLDNWIISSFLSTIVAILMFLLELLPIYYVMVCLVLLIGSLIMRAYNGN